MNLDEKHLRITLESAIIYHLIGNHIRDIKPLSLISETETFDDSVSYPFFKTDIGVANPVRDLRI